MDTPRTSPDAESDADRTATNAPATGTPAATPLPRRLALAAAALAIPFLFDRLCLTTPFAHDGRSFWTRWAVLCLAIAAIGAILFAGRARRTPMWWTVFAAITVLGVWLIVFAPEAGSMMAGGANLIYATLTGMVAMPALLMALLQLSDGRFAPYRPFGLAAAWLKGWLIAPFTRWGVLAGTMRDAGARLRGGEPGAGADRARRIGIALLIALPILLLLVPLLTSADESFADAIGRLIGGFDVAAVMRHAMIVLVPAPFVFSLLESVDERGIAEPAAVDPISGAADRPRPFDPLIVAVVLGIVLTLYIAFCAFQFRFMFSGGELPAGHTYAGYARSGFFQLLFVAVLNLAGFGLVLRFTPRRTPIVAMQIGLIAATGVMLTSAFMRLNLYIHVYGLTWLRYTSMTFTIPLAALLLLALIRLFTERIPLVAVGFAALLVWWIAIGYADPGRVIDWWNASHGMAIG